MNKVLNSHLIHLKMRKILFYSIILKTYKLYTKMLQITSATHLWCFHGNLTKFSCVQHFPSHLSQLKLIIYSNIFRKHWMIYQINEKSISNSNVSNIKGTWGPGWSTRGAPSQVILANVLHRGLWLRQSASWCSRVAAVSLGKWRYGYRIVMSST